MKILITIILILSAASQIQVCFGGEVQKGLVPLSPENSKPFLVPFNTTFESAKVTEQMRGKRYSLRGPIFYRDENKKDIVFGRVSIGFLGWFEVEFKNDESPMVINSCFRAVGTEWSFETFSEMETAAIHDLSEKLEITQDDEK